MSVKTLVITQCFAKADILQFSMKNLYEFGSGKWDEHWIVLKKYPIHEKENREKILEYAKQYNCLVHDCEEDLGATEGLNHFFAHHPQPKGTRYIGFDPDTLVQSKNFDVVLNEVMDADSNISVCAMNNLEIWTKKERLRQYETTVAGHNIIKHPSVAMYNCCMIDIDWVLSLPKKFWEPFKYYGGIESYFFDHMRREGKYLAYLLDYKEQYDGLLEQYKDAEYQQWKHDHLSGFEGSLKEWLIAKGKQELLV